MVNKHPVAIFFVFTDLDFFKKYQRTTSYSCTSTWYYMIVYIIYIHIFSALLFWTSFGSPWTSAFASDFCAGNHRLKTASFEALFCIILCISAAIWWRSDFWHLRGDQKDISHGIFWHLFDGQSSSPWHPWGHRHLWGDDIRARSKVISQFEINEQGSHLVAHHQGRVWASSWHLGTSSTRSGRTSWHQEDHQDPIKSSTSLEAHQFEPASIAGHHSHILADLWEPVVHGIDRDIILDQFQAIHMGFGSGHQGRHHQFLGQTSGWESSSSDQSCIWLASGWDWLIKSFHHQGELHPEHLWRIHLASRIPLGLSHPIPCIVFVNSREHQVLLCIDQRLSTSCWTLHLGWIAIWGISRLCQCLHLRRHQHESASELHQGEIQRTSGSLHLCSEEQLGEHREVCVRERGPTISAILPRWRSRRGNGIRGCETSMWFHHSCRWIDFHPHGVHRACRCIEGILKSATGRRTSERVTSLIHRLDSWILIWDINFLLYSMSSTQHLFE